MPGFGALLAGGLAFGAASGAASGAAGTAFGGINAKRQWKYRQKEMALQQQYALEQMQKQADLQRLQFDYENEYNSPVNVFSRYRKAGINPAAVLGSSGASMSSTMPMPTPPSGGHVSSGFPIGGMDRVNVNPVEASQIKYNNAAAANQQSLAGLSDEKATTEQSVRNMLAASVDEKVADTYFTTQRGIYQSLVNAKTTDVLDAQITELRAQADHLIASASLSEAQIDLVRTQTIDTFFNSQLKKAQMSTQSAIGKYYHNLAGFVSLQSEDLDLTIQALSTAQEVTTYTMNKNGDAVPVTYKVSGYDAKRLASLFGAMRGAADAAREAIQADWENPKQWNEAIDIYWDNINGSAKAASDIIGTLNPLKFGSRTATSFVNSNGQLIGGTESIHVPYRE